MPANEIVGLLPGELFVHRNVANVVVHTDLNCLSVLQYAVDVLKVQHVIVCGHYGCGGVRRRSRRRWADRQLAAPRAGRRDSIRAPRSRPRRETRRVDRLCELNVIEQVLHVCQTTIVQDAWHRGQPLRVHGWIYGLRDGRLAPIRVRLVELAERTHPMNPQAG